MKHIQILFLILNVLIGVGIIYYSYIQQKTYKKPLLKNLMLYIICFNVLILVNLSYKYLLSNIFLDDFDKIPNYVTSILFLIIFFSEFGFVFYLIKTILNLANKKMPITLNYVAGSWGLLFTALSITGIFLYNNNSNIDFIFTVHKLWVFSIILVVFTALTALFFMRKKANQKQKEAIKRFLILFSMAFFLFAISQIDFYYLKIGITDYDPIILLIVNLTPFLWLQMSKTKLSFWANTNSISLSANLSKTIDKYNISDREEEVIKLVIEGKSNKEIEEELYISFNTVKNHIYNIYKKIGVKSRTQLINFFSNNTRIS